VPGIPRLPRPVPRPPRPGAVHRVTPFSRLRPRPVAFASSRPLQSTPPRPRAAPPGRSRTTTWTPPSRIGGLPRSGDTAAAAIVEPRLSITTASDPGLIRLNWLPWNTATFQGFPRRWAAGQERAGPAPRQRAFSVSSSLRSFKKETGARLPGQFVSLAVGSRQIGPRLLQRFLPRRSHRFGTADEGITANWARLSTVGG
jgi:hypothetical protein